MENNDKNVVKKPSYGLSYKHFIQASLKPIWVIYFMKVIEAGSYMAGSLILKPYLMENFNFTDYEAGVAYGIYGVQISIIGILMGVVIDKIGIRLSFLYGLFILTIARTHLALTNNRTHLLWNLYLFLPLGTAFGIPVLTIALRRYVYSCNSTPLYFAVAAHTHTHIHTHAHVQYIFSNSCDYLMRIGIAQNVMARLFIVYTS